MRWFGGGKDAIDHGNETHSADNSAGDVLDTHVPAFKDNSETHYVYVTKNNDGERFIMSTPFFSASLPLLCSGSRELCEAFVEGHRMGFRNAASRRHLLLSVLSEEYIFAHKLLTRIADGEVTSEELEEEMAFFERMRSDTRARGQDQFLGVTDFGEGETHCDQVPPQSRQDNVVQMTDYLGVNDGAA